MPSEGSGQAHVDGADQRYLFRADDCSHWRPAVHPHRRTIGRSHPYYMTRLPFDTKSPGMCARQVHCPFYAT